MKQDRYSRLGDSAISGGAAGLIGTASPLEGWLTKKNEDGETIVKASIARINFRG